jgi:hypothetical protein
MGELKRIEDYNKVLPILELYRCVQSEGSRFGRPTIASYKNYRMYPQMFLW